MKDIIDNWREGIYNNDTFQIDVCNIKFNSEENIYKVIPNIVQQCYELARTRFPVRVNKDNPSFDEIQKGRWNEDRSYWTELLVHKVLTRDFKLNIDLKSMDQLKENKEIIFRNRRMSIKHSYIIENLLSSQERISQIFPEECKIVKPETLGIFTTYDSLASFLIVVKVTDLVDVSETLYTYIHEFVHFLNFLEILYRQGELDKKELSKIIRKSFGKGLKKWFKITKC